MTLRPSSLNDLFRQTLTDFTLKVIKRILRKKLIQAYIDHKF